MSGGILPAIEHLPGPDKDARPGQGDAVPRNVEVGGIAVARLRSRQHAEDSEMLGERDARAAQTRSEDKNARRGSTGDTLLLVKVARPPARPAPTRQPPRVFTTNPPAQCPTIAQKQTKDATIILGRKEPCRCGRRA